MLKIRKGISKNVFTIISAIEYTASPIEDAAPLKSPLNNFPIDENIFPMFSIAVTINLKGDIITSKTVPKMSLIVPTIESPNPALKKFKIVLNG